MDNVRFIGSVDQIKGELILLVFLDITLVIYSIFYLSLFFTDYSFICPTISINNILVPSLGLVGLLLLRWLVNKNSFKNSIFVSFYLKLKDINDKNLVIFLAGLAFLFFAFISILRHYSLLSAGYDLGIFDQGVWNCAHGNPLFCTIKYTQGGSLLGDHFEPILFFIAPVYFIWPNVLVLLILQPLLLASALIPLYLIGKSVLKDRFLIFAFLMCYILSKPVRGIVYFDFYPEAFMVPALFWGYYFLIKRNNLLLWLSIIVVLLCKEDTTFLVLALGLYALLVQQRRWLGISFIAVAVLLWWIETGHIIPYFSPMHNYEYLSKLPFGTSYLDNFKFCFFHPVQFAKFIFTKQKIDYMLRLFGPLGFLSLLSPSQFILNFIPLLKNLLGTSKSSIYYTINTHYVAGVIPFVFISAIYGCHALMQRLTIKNGSIIVGLFLIGITLLFLGKTDGCRIAGFFNNMKINYTLQKIRALDLIPSDASVIATDNLCPHLSHRSIIYYLDPRGEQPLPKDMPEYIAIDKGQLTPMEAEVIDNYLSRAESKGYRVVSSIQDNNFMILASSESGKETK